MTTIGIDNGSTGSIAVLGPSGALFESVPTRDCLHYGKNGTISQRLDGGAFALLIAPFLHDSLDVRVFIERPFTGSPMMIKTMLASHRFFEATIIALEDLKLGYQVVDSREWQAALLGNVKTSALLKKASKLRGLQLYPALTAAIESHGDADGLLIAHYYHASSLP